jgi:hypothetical protein
MADPPTGNDRMTETDRCGRKSDVRRWPLAADPGDRPTVVLALADKASHMWS